MVNRRSTTPDSQLLAPENVLTIFGSPPICDLIFSCFDFADLKRISLTCRLVQKSISSFCRRAYDIRRFLSNYFDDVVGFRNLQARTTALIGGSSALQFFERATLAGAALDIFVQDIYAKEFGNWIVANGYMFVPTLEQSEGTDAMFDNIEQFKQQQQLDDPHWYVDEDRAGIMDDFSKIVNISSFEKADVKVKLICTRGNPMQCILISPCTCVMNYITHEGAYSLYPAATFVKRKAAAVVQDIDEQEQEVLDKYKQRGWEIIWTESDLPQSALDNLFRIDRVRHPQDELTWRVPFNTDDIDACLQSRYNPALYSSWSIDHEYYFHSHCEFTISSWHFSHDRLLHSYRVASSQLSVLLENYLDNACSISGASPEEKLDKALCEKAAAIYNKKNCRTECGRRSKASHVPRENGKKSEMWSELNAARDSISAMQLMHMLVLGAVRIAS